MPMTLAMPITTLTPPEPDDLTSRFSPERLKVSGMFTAILARMLGGFSWTEPAIFELCLTKDAVLAVREGDIGANDFLCSVEDLMRNLRGVVDVVDPTHDERLRLASLFGANVTDHGSGFNALEAVGLA